jgi:hypothetical protein
VDDPELDLYPYKPRGYRSPVYDSEETSGASYGIFVHHDVELASIRRLSTTIAQYGAKRVLVLTSAIMGPIVDTVIRSVPEFSDFFAQVELYLRVPEHRFWGGNILLGDLYTVSDYLNGARDFMEESGVTPDLIALPSSFATEFGYDLLGVSYTELERALDIPVELIPCPRIMI